MDEFDHTIGLGERSLCETNSEGHGGSAPGHTFVVVLLTGRNPTILQANGSLPWIYPWQVLT